MLVIRPKKESRGAEDVPNGGGLHDAALLMSWWKVGIELVDLNSSALTFQLDHMEVSIEIPIIQVLDDRLSAESHGF